MTATQPVYGPDVDATERPAARHLSEPTWSESTTTGDLVSPGWRLIEQVVCAVVLVLIGWRSIFHLQLSYGLLIGLALLPVWVGAPRRFHLGRLFLGFGLASYLVGCLLSVLAVTRSRLFDAELFSSDSGLVLMLLVGIAVMLWARTIMSPRLAALFFGIGFLLRPLISGADPENPWKFGWAIPVTMIVLALCQTRRPRPALNLLVLLILAAVSATQDSRSLFATFLIAAVLLAWQLRPAPKPGPRRWLLGLVLIAALAVAVYNLGVGLLVDGYFGEDARQRTLAQIQSAGSLILGGRPELAATLALIRHTPFGFGLGVSPNIADIGVAKTAMVAIGYDPDNGYVDRYMFGGHVELHSTFGDLWALTGVAGLLLTVVIVVVLARGLFHSMVRRDGNGLLLFMICFSGWNLLFSPLFSAIPILTLSVGLGLVLRRTGEPIGSAAGVVPKRAQQQPDPFG